MVLPMSTASAPISMASAISPIMSPACVPTITTSQCGTGSRLNFTIAFPQALPANTKYYKYGPEFGGSQEPHWYILENAVISGNQITLSITDNGVGDSNPSNGFITDPGGPGVSAAASIPTLSEWGLILLASLLGLLGRRPMR
jgi:hypothetical protein